jgi:membrane protein DedA with SNARE-associated domain
VLALILVPFFLFGDALTAWASLQLQGTNKWFLGFFIAALLASDIFLPIPASIVGTSAGVLLGFAGGVSAATTGMCVGAILGYAAGASAAGGILRKVVSERELLRASGLIDRYGAFALVLSRPIPVLAEASVVAAGVAKMPVSKFLVVSTLANLGVSAGYAAVGAFSYQKESFLLAFAGSIGVPAVAMALYRLFGWRALRGIR